MKQPSRPLPVTGQVSMKAVVDQLNRMFRQVNSQLGKLAPQDGPPQVLVAYRVQGFVPRMDLVGGMHLKLAWFTQPPVCTQVVPGGTQEHPQICGQQATHLWQGQYVCAAHAPAGAQLLTDVVAREQGPADESETEGH